MFCNPYLQGQREGRGGKEMSSLCLIVPRFYKVENEQSTKKQAFPALYYDSHSDTNTTNIAWLVRYFIQI